MDSLLERIERVSVSTLTPHPENPRRGNIELIAESLATNGQFQPLVVQDSTSYILAGNHTFKAATLILGWPEIDIVRVDVNDEAALRILLAANRTADDGSYDELLLATLLGEIREEDESLLIGTGYSAEEVDEMLANAVILEPDTEESEEQVSHIAAMLNRIIPMTAEDALVKNAEDQQKIIDAAARAEKYRQGQEEGDTPYVQPVQYVIFQFGELRAKVVKKTYDDFMKWFMTEHEDNLSKAGVAAVSYLGVDPDDVLPAIAETAERWL